MDIGIVPVGTVPNSILNYLKYELGSFVPVGRVQRERQVELPNVYDSLRMQYPVIPFLSIVDESIAPIRVLITDVDIFIEPLPFVFSHQNGMRGIISLNRLNTVESNGREDPAIMRTRVMKEVLHVIGHISGLGHCRGRCAMKMAHDAMDIDKKPASYCSRCLPKVKKFLKSKK